MLLQGTCKRLYKSKHKVFQCPAHVLHPSRTLDLPASLTCITLYLSRPAPLTYPRSSSVTHLHHAVPLTSCTSYVPSIFQRHSPASRLHVPAAPSAKRRIFSVPVTSSTPRVVAIPSFPTFSFLLHAHQILKWLWLLRQL